MERLLGHRRPKGPATDKPTSWLLPRHFSTLPRIIVLSVGKSYGKISAIISRQFEVFALVRFDPALPLSLIHGRFNS
jgi:hypothetical protein